MSSESDRKLILLIDDDRDLVAMLRTALEREGYRIAASHDGRDGLKQFYALKPDLVVLDIVLPVMDGWLVCERIREMSNTPLLILTGRTKNEEVTRGLYLGADDYMVKPFGVTEFMARVRAVVRRSMEAPKHAPQSLLTIDAHLSVDLAKRRVIVDGRPGESLSPTEQRLLAVLAAHAGEVVTTEDLLRRVWGDESRRSAGHLKTYVHYLRHKIEPNPAEPRFILTERGVGYRFSART
ncbi:MAG: response regulator transcription factor [Anaerolineae bacterium]|nr:response regulator transcription factor [Anaerolineae bacterium]